MNFAITYRNSKSGIFQISLIAKNESNVANSSFPKHMMKTLLLFMLVPVLLSGCSTRWVKIRDNPTDHVTSRSICRVNAEQKFPVQNEVAYRTGYSTITEPCENRRRCGGKKYRTVQIEELQSYVTDVNDGSRNGSYYDCMWDNGWQQQTKSNWEWDRTPITQQYTGPAK